MTQAPALDTSRGRNSKFDIRTLAFPSFGILGSGVGIKTSVTQIIQDIGNRPLKTPSPGRQQLTPPAFSFPETVGDGVCVFNCKKCYLCPEHALPDVSVMLKKPVQ